MTARISITGAVGTTILTSVLGACLWMASRAPESTIGPAGWGMVVLGATAPTDPSTGTLDRRTDPPAVTPAPVGDWHAGGEWIGWLAGQSPAFGSNHN